MISGKGTLTWIWRKLSQVTAFIILLWLIVLFIFAFFPVPFSMVMVERQVTAWLTGDFSYTAHSDWVPMSQISPYMSLAVMAAEDQKFPEHWGFDFDAIESVLTHNQNSRQRLRGASTLSQQMTKNLFLWDGRSWLRKGIEAALTTVVELVWTKRRILTVYLNIVEFDKGIFGVEAASRYFFNKPASRITASEAALMAAVLPNPYRFKVNAPSGYVIQRQQWILRQMQQLDGTAFLQQNNLQH